MDADNLSLETFEPGRAYAPYLTTPRSLEACRMSGVNPIELVEIPVAEFKKDFPNDPDAAQRRYERIEGARQRIYKKVKEDWDHLVKTNWKPHRERTEAQKAKERILEVPEDVHCGLLENQADQFRKIEKDTMQSLERMLKLELRKSMTAVNNKKIIGKHDAISAQNESLKAKNKAMRDAAIQAEIDRQRKKEEDFRAETKKQQAYEQQLAKQESKNAAQKARLDRE